MSLLGTAALYLSCTDELSSTLAMEVEGREGGRGWQEWAERVGLGFELVRLFLLVLMGFPAVSAHASDWPHFGRGKQ